MQGATKYNVHALQQDQQHKILTLTYVLTHFLKCVSQESLAHLCNNEH